MSLLFCVYQDRRSPYLVFIVFKTDSMFRSDMWKWKSSLQMTVFTRYETVFYLELQSLFQVIQNLSEMAQCSFNSLLMEPFIESLMYSYTGVVLFWINSRVSPFSGNYSYYFCSVSIEMKEIHIQFLLWRKLIPDSSVSIYWQVKKKK